MMKDEGRPVYEISLPSSTFAFPKTHLRKLISAFILLLSAFCLHKSCPQYDRLKLLLQSGKSEIWPLRSASATPSQL